jgi:hypothetical protein
MRYDRIGSTSRRRAMDRHRDHNATQRARDEGRHRRRRVVDTRTRENGVCTRRGCRPCEAAWSRCRKQVESTGVDSRVLPMREGRGVEIESEGESVLTPVHGGRSVDQSHLMHAQRMPAIQHTTQRERRESRMITHEQSEMGSCEDASVGTHQHTMRGRQRDNIPARH